MQVLKRPQKVLADAMLSNDCQWKELPFCCSLLQRNVIPEESRQMCSVWRRLLVLSGFDLYWATQSKKLKSVLWPYAHTPKRPTSILTRIILLL